MRGVCSLCVARGLPRNGVSAGVIPLCVYLLLLDMQGHAESGRWVCRVRSGLYQRGLGCFSSHHTRGSPCVRPSLGSVSGDRLGVASSFCLRGFYGILVYIGLYTGQLFHCSVLYWAIVSLLSIVIVAARGKLLGWSWGTVLWTGDGHYWEWWFVLISSYLCSSCAFLFLFLRS